MKNVFKICLLCCFFLSTGSAFAQQGKVIEEQVIKSKILKRNVKYTIYLPADYETANRTYPVVYLLHGYTDDNTGWLQFGEVNRYADQAILDGTIPPMIIVMPDGGTSWYINSYDGKEKYEDFFIKEFIPHVEQAYRIKNRTAIPRCCGPIHGWLRNAYLRGKIPAAIFGSRGVKRCRVSGRANDQPAR